MILKCTWLGGTARLISTGQVPILRRFPPPNVLRTIVCQTRSFSQQQDPERPSSRNTLKPLLTLLLVAGIGATAYGVYDIYDTLTLWPPEVRGDLRAGLRAKSRGDSELSEQYLRRAWETAKTLPIDTFKVQPHLKTSGIAVCLAGMLESSGKTEKAYEVYLDALTRLQEVGTKEPLSGQEKLRAVAISYKLGELAGLLERPKDEERHLLWAVEVIVKSIPEDSLLESESSPVVDPDTQTMIRELALPDWATKTDIAAPFEALGSYFARIGNPDYAIPLYQQAISILIPPPPKSSSAEDRCRGAQLMSNVSELIIRYQHHLTPTNLKQAELWAAKGLDIAMHSNNSSSAYSPTCAVALAVALFNVAAIRRMAGANEEAKEFFTLSLKQSKSIGMKEGVLHSEAALRQLEEESGSTLQTKEHSS